MGNKIRYALPVLFVIILTYQLRGQFFGPSLTVPPVGNPRPPISEPDPDDFDEKSQIKGEFHKLVNALNWIEKNRAREPPDTLDDALAAAERDWQDKRESPSEAFRWLRSAQSPGADPWGHACEYRVDPQAREITLHSFGPNGQNDEANADSDDYDDIVVTVPYGHP
jgi:hypothetical protein